MFCPQCGTQVTEQATHCPGCGIPLTPAVPVQPTVSTQPTAPVSSAAPIYQSAPAQPAAPVYQAAPVRQSGPVYQPIPGSNPVFTIPSTPACKQEPSYNTCCVLSCIFGAISMLFNPLFLCSIVGMILGIIGLATFREDIQHGRVCAILGILFSVLGVLIFLLACSFLFNLL